MAIFSNDLVTTTAWFEATEKEIADCLYNATEACITQTVEFSDSTKMLCNDSETIFREDLSAFKQVYQNSDSPQYVGKFESDLSDVRRILSSEQVSMLTQASNKVMASSTQLTLRRLAECSGLGNETHINTCREEAYSGMNEINRCMQFTPNYNAASRPDIGPITNHLVATTALTLYLMPSAGKTIKKLSHGIAHFFNSPVKAEDAENQAAACPHKVR